MIATFHHRDFSLRDLRQRKATQGIRVSCCIPTLNEAATIAGVVQMARRHPLIDEVVVMDSGSEDQTCDIAAAAGASVYVAAAIRPDLGTAKGKGENLWKALFVAQGELIVYIDGDLRRPSAVYLTGLLGPLLTYSHIHYVKACYERLGGGGRVTELLARPMLQTFWPELAGLHQPLAGEYAARREFLQELPFPTGYSVEAIHLVEIVAQGRLSALAQTYVGRRAHRARPLSELGPMSQEILQALLRRLQQEGRLTEHMTISPALERPSFNTVMADSAKTKASLGASAGRGGESWGNLAFS